MYPLDEIFYSPALRAKKGEFDACFALDHPSKERLLPDFVLPSLIPEEDSTFSVDDLINQMVGSVAKCWGSRPCLLDLRFVKSSMGSTADAARIEQLLVRSRLAGSRVIPVVGLATDFHRVAAAGKHVDATKSGAAIRVTLNDLNSPELEQLIEIQLTVLNVPSTDCLLVLDLSEADLSERDEFTQFISNWLVKLYSFGPWYKIIVQATNYPQSNPAPEGGEYSVPRSEWSIWQSLLSLEPRMQTFAIFGDFGADHGRINYKSGGRAAIPHLRYTTQTDWLVVRGHATHATIRSVAQRIVDSGAFSGEFFSVGDEFIASRARGAAGVGSPTSWRTVNMNHHMTWVTVRLGALLGIAVPQISHRRASVQESLFEAAE
jgi:hypothetical protein